MLVARVIQQFVFQLNFMNQSNVPSDLLYNVQNHDRLMLRMMVIEQNSL